MCPYCAVRGRHDGGARHQCRARRQSGAAAKISEFDQRRESLVIHQCPPQEGGAPETFGELNRWRGLRSLFETFDAERAILSAQYDGLYREDQLTCGAWTCHDILMTHREPPTMDARINL
jgi:hypothetical protein